MRIIVKIYLVWISCVAIVVGELAAGGGTAIVRPNSDWAAWSAESNSITQFYRTELKIPEDAKVVLLFVGVKLGLNDPVAEKGAALNEFAFVYSELKNDNGVFERKVTVMTRVPYLDRQWMTESVNIVEGKEPLGNVLTLNDKVDIYTQISQYAKRIIPTRGSGDHIIAMIVFEEAVVGVLGRNLNDGEVLDLTKRQIVIQAKPE